jgi:hypothetical protein
MRRQHNWTFFSSSLIQRSHTLQQAVYLQRLLNSRAEQLKAVRLLRLLNEYNHDVDLIQHYREKRHELCWSLVLSWVDMT